MKDKKIARLVAQRVFFSSFSDDETDRAIAAFVERVVIPKEVGVYTFFDFESYIRDALKRKTDHWTLCPPEGTSDEDQTVSSFNDVE